MECLLYIKGEPYLNRVIFNPCKVYKVYRQMSRYYQNIDLTFSCYLVCKQRSIYGFFILDVCHFFLDNEWFYSIPQRRCKQKPGTTPVL